jgi:hypothetical protein
MCKFENSEICTFSYFLIFKLDSLDKLRKYFTFAHNLYYFILQ